MTTPVEAPGSLVPHLPSTRIRSAMGWPGARLSTLGFYLRLQTGRWWEWALIWLLQNVRYCPVYVLPYLTGYLIDRIDRSQPQRALGELPWILGATLGMCILTVVCNATAHGMLSRLARSLSAGLRAALIRRINRLEFAFHDRAQFGALHSKFTLDVGRLEGYQSFLSEALLMYGTVVVVMLAIISATNPLLLLVIAVGVPLHLLLVRLFWHRIEALNEAYCTAETGFAGRIAEALQGLRLTRAHATEDFVDRRVSQAAGMVAEKAMRLDLMNNLFGSGGWAVSTFLNMGVVGLGVWLAVGSGQRFEILGHSLTVQPITLGEFTILMSYYGLIAGAMSTILGGMPAVAAAHDAIRSLAQLFVDEDEEANAGKPQLAAVRGEVAFEGVRFRYPGSDIHCLEGIDLRIPAGTSLALVGPSGSGKSTVVSLILGFYQPTAGRVLIDGQDLAAIDRRSLRQHIGVVSQDVVLFQDTILSNIAWGDERPDRERAHDAARRANALEFIERLPDRLDHVLGDRGGGLSGGQRQRLAIARAIYRDPRLLILDEATSALDQESERQVQAALDEVRRGRTTVIIAHRLATVRSADRIDVLSGGRVVESGSFAELMAGDGPFRRMARGQLF